MFWKSYQVWSFLRDCILGNCIFKGTQLNKKWELFDEDDLKKTAEDTFKASRIAYSLIYNSTPIEAALICSIQVRYQGDDKIERSQYSIINNTRTECKLYMKNLATI